MRSISQLLAAVLLCGAAGCAAVTTDYKETTMDKVPAKVVAGLSRKYSDLKITSVVHQTFADGSELYRFNGFTDDGKGPDIAVKVLANGKVLN